MDVLSADRGASLLLDPDGWSDMVVVSVLSTSTFASVPVWIVTAARAGW